MKSLADLLPKATEPMGLQDDERCPRCHVHTHLDHQCCTCLDGGRISMGAPLGDPMFGRSVACPDCASAFGGGAAITREEFERRSRIPKLFANANFKTWDSRRYKGKGDPRARARKWAENVDAYPFLVLIGNTGNGKTHLAIAALRHCFELRGTVGEFWPAPTIIDRFKATMDRDRATETEQEVADRLLRCPVLVVDDYGAHYGTEWAASRLYGLLNARYGDMKPTIVTSNSQFGQDRVVSRLLDQSVSIGVQFDSPDTRLG